jgi:hypothetical protein
MSRPFVLLLCLFSAVLGASLAANSAIGAIMLAGRNTARKREETQEYRTEVPREAEDIYYDQEEQTRRQNQVDEMMREFPEMAASLNVDIGSERFTETLS